MAKKVLSLILVLLLLSLSLVACGGREEEPPTTDGGNTSGDDIYGDDPADEGSDSGSGSSTDSGSSDGGEEDDGGEEEEEESNSTSLGDGYVDKDILKKLPQADYEGKQFSISLPNSEHSYQFDPDKITADPEKDAIYRWKKKVQDTFNVKIVHQNWNSDSYYADASPAIKNNLSTHNIYGHYAFKINEFIINGCFQDWNALGTQVDANGTKYLDLSNSERWDKMLNDEVTYNGKLLSLTGDLGVSKLQSAMAMFVNFDLLEQYAKIDSKTLYGYVDSGDWTFTTFKTVVAKIYKNNATPGYDVNDTLGYYAKSGNSGDIWFPAFNRETTTRGDGTIKATFMTDATNKTLISELRAFLHGGTNVMYKFLSAGDPNEEAKFLSETLGFVSTSFKSVYGQDGFNNMSNFGVVPVPKYDTNQTVYRTKLNDRFTIWGLPTSLKSTERQFTAHITDALCAESSETLYYQYYEVILKGRYSQDPETARMVDKVMENTHFDTTIQFGSNLNMHDYTYLPRNLIADPTMAIESTYDAAANKLGSFLQQIYDCYK